MMRRLWSRVTGQAVERGQALVIAAMFMTVLLGFASFVMDFGQMALERRRLQNAVDAGALAGVQVLPKFPSNAVSAATTWAMNNGATGGELAAPTVSQTNANNDTITVTATRQVPFHFGKVLGFTERPVSTNAKAIVGSVVGGKGIMPFGIEDDNGSAPGFGYTFGQQIAIKEVPGNQSMGPGNYGFLALDARGGRNLRDVLENGGSSTLYRVGDEVDTEPGQKTGPLEQGLTEWARRNGDTINSTCNDWSGSHSYVNGKLIIAQKCQYRVILIPVIDEWPNGRKGVTIVGFAQMYLRGFDEDDDKRLDGIFLNDSFSHPDIVFGPVNDYGTRVVKLTR